MILFHVETIDFDKPDPDRLLDLEGDMAAEVRALLAKRGFADDDLGAALAAWAGIENYEERLVAGKIDPLVLAKLREI